MELVKDKTLEDIIIKIDYFIPLNAKERSYLERLDTNDAKALLEIDKALLFLCQSSKIKSMMEETDDDVENVINKLSLRDIKKALEKIKSKLEKLEPESKTV